MKKFVTTILSVMSLSSAALAGVTCNYNLVNPAGTVTGKGEVGCDRGLCDVIASIPSDKVDLRVNGARNIDSGSVYGYFNVAGKQSTFRSVGLRPDKEPTRITSISFEDGSQASLDCRNN